jgi:hypothetical protein
VPWGDVGSQIPMSDHQDSRSFQPSVVRYAVLFPTFYAMLYALSDRDSLVTAFECVDTVGIIHHPDVPSSCRVDGEESHLAQRFSGSQLLRVGVKTSIL